jgi:tRNA(adenine34) deaminase
MKSYNNDGQILHSIAQAMGKNHEKFMKMAIAQAEIAGSTGEVPIGAVLVDGDGRLVCQDHNRTIRTCDPTAHAEINVLRAAAQKCGNYRLLSSTLYVTIEPCAMCMGAIIHARVATIVFGARDPKWGAVKSLYQMGYDTRLNHQVDVVEGICAETCRSVIQEFFHHRRKNRKNKY